jgi:methyl-accepting chemotaxis protein
MMKSDIRTRLIAALAALMLPAVVLAFFYFGQASTTEIAVVVGISVVCLAAAVWAAHAAFAHTAELESKLDGIHATRQVIEYKPDGTILWANAPFLKLLGYSLEDIVGRHHRIFVDQAYGQSAEYREFWARLGRGEFIEQRYKRQAAGGRDIWVLTNYTPVRDSAGKLFKVVNWMTDLTSAHMEQAVVVDTLAAGLHKLAEGDLSSRIDTTLQGEYDLLRQNFNSAVTRLQEAMQAVLQSAGAINSGAGEISQAADDLSRRTEQQAAGLEQTAAALEEITATVKTTATNAREATRTTVVAKGAAEEGGKVVETAIQAMDAIAQSSKQINDIIGVIDEIAFQTNLLALNAGVEAARAGDAGKGFAVVASEVRALAQRSGEAAKQIRALILTSREQVESGVRYVGNSGAALKNIVENVALINSLVKEMAQAAEQQSTGIEEVNNAVAQMDQVTQQNAAMVEQSTAASRNLATETQKLSGIVGFFKVGGTALSMRSHSEKRNEASPSLRKPAPKPLKAARGGKALAVAPEADGDWTEF